MFGGRLRLARAMRLPAEERGSTAVEFALVAVPFIAILFAILETAIVFTAGEFLQTTVADASRTIMTGQASGSDKEAFKAAICDRLTALFDCKGKLSVDVRTLKTLSGAGRASPYVNGAYDTSNWGYEVGGSGAVVIVTAAYPWPVYVNLLGSSLANAPGNRRLLMASAVFKNEKFGP